MPGYVLLEKNSLTPPRPEGQGINANTKEIGFSDFLRELEQDEFPFNEYTSLKVTGLEELFIEARPNMESFARIIRQKLQSHANDFFNKGCGDIQIVFRGKLIRGERLMDDHPTENIPIHIIFGSPPPEEINGHKIFKIGFNLSGN